MRDSKSYTLLDAVAVRAITSSTDATPIVVTTSANHGLSTGAIVNISGHTTNIAANGTYKITVTAVNKFSLQTLDGVDVAGTGAGAGSGGSFNTYAKRIFIQDYRNAVLSFDTDGGGDAAMTVKLVGSVAENCPDFAKAQSTSNQYDYIEMIDLQSGSNIDGDTGFVVATADDHRQFEANINGLRWLSVIPTAGTAGEITVKVRVFDNQ